MSEAGITVSIQFFASARELTGVRNSSIELVEDHSLTGLKARLIQIYPALSPRLDHFLVSVNQEFVTGDLLLNDGDEVGIFPPVSGGSDLPCIRLVTEDAIDLNKLSAQIQAPHIGAAVIFTGFVRGETPGAPHPKTMELNYEAYEPMAQKMMLQICDEIRARWPKVYGIFLVQRIGTLRPMEITTAIGVSSGHRDEGAFEAAKYGINRLKEIVPVWKKEIGPTGEEWVEGTFRPENPK